MTDYQKTIYREVKLLTGAWDEGDFPKPPMPTTDSPKGRWSRKDATAYHKAVNDWRSDREGEIPVRPHLTTRPALDASGREGALDLILTVPIALELYDEVKSAVKSHAPEFEHHNLVGCELREEVLFPVRLAWPGLGVLLDRLEGEWEFVHRTWIGYSPYQSDQNVLNTGWKHSIFFYVLIEVR